MGVLRHPALFLGVAALAACTKSGPYSTEDRAALQGSIYYVTGGSEHGEGTTVKRLRLSDGRVDALTGGEAPAFVYGQSPTDGRLALTVADDLYLARPDGSELTKVASSPELDWYPRFSPDGRFLVFESARASFRDLYRLELSTSEVVRLTDNEQGNFDATWSPDGRKLAFASSRAGQLDLWVMDADGANPKRLTFHPGDSVKPAWSPSGKYIAFISARDGKDDLFVVRPDGSDIRKLTPEAEAKKRWEGAARRALRVAPHRGPHRLRGPGAAGPQPAPRGGRGDRRDEDAEQAGRGRSRAGVVPGRRAHRVRVGAGRRLRHLHHARGRIPSDPDDPGAGSRVASPVDPG
ncbi:MAG: PD40 domain-containing protein [Myxococcales bacterium]|nr:PD40 domain-containing protein [Myxococcales bacterium]